MNKQMPEPSDRELTKKELDQIDEDDLLRVVGGRSVGERAGPPYVGRG